jgi:hypothetical protein
MIQNEICSQIAISTMSLFVIGATELMAILPLSLDSVLQKMTKDDESLLCQESGNVWTFEFRLLTKSAHWPAT